MNGRMQGGESAAWDWMIECCQQTLNIQSGIWCAVVSERTGGQSEFLYPPSDTLVR